jgi:SAM-dependent methyltransferase
MATTRKSSLQTAGRLLGFAELEHLEAPDQTFIGHRDILVRSLSRYRFVAPHIQGATLDIGCGRGYGFDMIRTHSSCYVGMDISQDFLHAAHRHYPTVSFVQGLGDELPFASHTFDSIISFEVIEHIEDDRTFLREIRRLARPGACIVISTPNRLIASGDTAKPLNPFHIREYLTDEFYDLLSGIFSSVVIFGQSEQSSNASTANSIINRIPMRWKYQIPSHIQGVISVALRPPLRLEDCHFETENLGRAHTLLALCRP